MCEKSSVGRAVRKKVLWAIIAKATKGARNSYRCISDKKSAHPSLPCLLIIMSEWVRNLLREQLFKTPNIAHHVQLFSPRMIL